MIPGLTSKGGKVPEVKAESYVAILCEGKQHALAIGKTTMSKEDMKRINKGIGIELLSYIGDDSWNVK
jgi:PUA domain protein